MSDPLFTVVLPAYARGAALRATLDGVLAQTEGSWELVVVDDASPDDTAEVAGGTGDERVRVLRRAERAGAPSAPRNDGLAVARGRWVAYLDHDDRWEPGHLATLRRAFERGAEVVATGCTWVDDRGGALRETGLLDLVWSPELALVGPLFEPSRVAHVTGLAEAAGGWRPTDGLEDWDLWVRLSDRTWSTTAARSVAIVEAEGTRRHDLGSTGWMAVAEVPDEARAHEVLRALHRPATLDRDRELHRRVMDDWYRAELSAAHLVLPDDAGPRDLTAALDAVRTEDPWALLGARREQGGTWTLGRSLLTTGDAHRDRVIEVLRRRLAPKYDHVRRVAASIAGERR
ncbi:glycosyltransferase family A protein [Patulibacter sp.]|uniref:glycosyltransferase family 2 protein n=1 Tax=Patulibacter sp. TaxID=1912859 RepID=UPI00271D87F1|nr:glycosyltransferase family A protein [Patulibacter sp.]MDO9407272.1 glycosyltransferase family A protein [Patulibacter sp.]